MNENIKPMTYHVEQLNNIIKNVSSDKKWLEVDNYLNSIDEIQRITFNALLDIYSIPELVAMGNKIYQLIRLEEDNRKYILKIGDRE